MNGSSVIRSIMAVTLAGGLFAPAGETLASGFQLQEQNASGLGNAYSGQAAAAEDASTVFWNPAGMTRIPGRQVVGGLSLVAPSSDFNNTGSTVATFQTSLGGNGGDGGELGAVPVGYLTWQLNPQIWLGLGLNVPFGLATEWDSSWVGRFHAIRSELLTVNVNPSIAWKVNEAVSLGVGVNWQYIDAELTNSTNYSAAAFGAGGAAALGALGLPGACPGATPGAGTGCEGVATLKADDNAWGWNVGAMFTLSPATRIGVAYRSEIKYNLSGTVSFANRPALLNAGLPDGNIKAQVTLPDTFSIGLSHQIDQRWQILADYTWTGWSSIQDLSIYRENGAPLTSTPLKFEDSYRVGVGANYQLSEPWKLRFGVAYDTTPVQDAFRTPRLPDQDRTWFATGAQWAFSKQGALDFGLAYLYIKKASSNLPNVEPAANLPAGFTAAPKGNLVGDYKADVWILSAQARYSF